MAYSASIKMSLVGVAAMNEDIIGQAIAISVPYKHSKPTVRQHGYQEMKCCNPRSLKEMY